MHASKAGVSLRNIALTPERIPTFIIPSKLQSPHAQLDSETDQSRLLSQSSPNQQLSASTPSSLVPRLPSTPTMRAKLHRNLSPGEDLSDPSTRAAMSLPHIDKVTTSYGFRALAQSPCTRRRESLFHKGAKTTGPSFETNMDCLSRPSSSVDVGDKRRTTSTNSNLADVPPGTAAPSPSVQILKTGRAAGLQTQLGMSQQKVQQRVQRREKELKELQQAVESLKRSAQEAAEDNERLFTELICSLEKWHTEVKELIKAQAKAQVSRAEGLLEQLEQEIAELKREDTELEQLSHTEDHIHFLQSYSNPSVSSSDLPAIVVSPHQYFGYVSEAVSELREKLQGFLKGQWTKISSTVNTVDVLLPPEPKTREQFLQYSCQLTLDPNTAHCKLSLSDGNKKMTAKLNHSYPGHPDRFTDRCQVLCSEGLSGRCYWEVERSGKDVSIAVSYKDIKTTGRIDSALGLNDKSWSLQCHHGYHFRHNNVEIQVSGPQSSRVGVYLDHKAGSLSFYSVSGTMILLHRVQTTFTQPLYPGFCFGYVGDTAELCKL